MKKHIKNSWPTILAIVLSLVVLIVLLPTAASADSLADKSEVRVVFVRIVTNTETQEVTTDLILKNNAAEEKEFTVSLPAITAGINEKTLTIRRKEFGPNTSDSTPEKSNENVSGTDLTLSIPAEGLTQISYSYTSGRNLAYEHTIGFDLTQLSDQFDSRIGHLEWIVDMPPYEIPLVTDVDPVNYIRTESGVLVELEDLLVTPLLNRISLSRTTHIDLIQEVADAEENGADMTLARFFLKNYRTWYRMSAPDVKEPLFPNEDTSYHLFNVYLQLEEGFTAEETALIDSFFRDQIYSDGDTTLPPSLKIDEETLERYKRIRQSDYSSLPTFLSNLYHYYLYEGSFGHEKPIVYAYLLTSEPGLADKTLIASATYETADFDFASSYSLATEEGLLLSSPMYPYNNEDQTRFRMVILREEDLADPGALRNYLQVLDVKALIRGKIRLGEIIPKDSLFAYDGTAVYPYDAFAADLSDAATSKPLGWDPNTYYSLIPCSEPLKDLLPIPVFTMYWGYAVPMNETQYAVDEDLTAYLQEHSISPANAFWMRNFDNSSPFSQYTLTTIENLLDHEIPLSMRQNVQQERDERARANRELMEAVMDVRIDSVSIHTNTKTGEVFTELILTNSTSADRELNFSLPAINAGIREDSLQIAATSEDPGAVREIDFQMQNDRITLKIPANASCKLSYSYQTERDLQKETEIGFSLTGLPRLFDDRIKHLKWSVEMPACEIPFVTSVTPKDCSMEENRIHGEWNDFSVGSSNYYVGLKQKVRWYLESAETFAYAGEDSSIISFLVDNYPKWYEAPDLIASLLNAPDCEFTNDDLIVLLYLTQKEGWPLKETPTILEFLEDVSDYDSSGKLKRNISHYASLGITEENLDHYLTIVSTFYNTFYGNAKFPFEALIYAIDPDGMDKPLLTGGAELFEMLFVPVLPPFTVQELKWDELSDTPTETAVEDPAGTETNDPAEESEERTSLPQENETAPDKPDQKETDPEENRSLSLGFLIPAAVLILMTGAMLLAIPMIRRKKNKESK